MKPFYSIETDNGIAFADVVPISDHNYSIVNLLIPYQERGKGIGSHIMQSIISDADNEKATLHLIARPYGTDNNLKKFYQRFGFASKRGSNIMLRAFHPYQHINFNK